jgi:hypothetical protein
MICGCGTQTFVINVSVTQGLEYPSETDPPIVPLGTLETVECLCGSVETVEAPVLYSICVWNRYGQSRSPHARG